MQHPFNLLRHVAGWSLALGIGVGVAGTAPLPFNSGSLQTIRAAHAGDSFILVLWSLRCAPCRDEMALLAAMGRQHPELDFVFVATDGMERAEEVAEILAQHDLAKAESWVFDGPDQRLRYEIDPNWYGTLPRSYFYDANHQRFTSSGVLEEARIRAWLDYLRDETAAPDHG